MRVYGMIPTVAALPLIALAVGARAPMRGPIQFGDARLIIELNDTAGDVGVQVFLDGEPWKLLQVFDPEGRKILQIHGSKSLRLQGLTELFFESSEPPLAELSLEDFFARFPAGEYEFAGITIEGERIEGTAIFTHAIPDAPIVLSPAEGSVQDVDSTVVAWMDVPDPPGSEIVAYQVIVTDLESGLPKKVFSVHVLGDVTSVTVPSTFLRRGVDYDLEVLSIEAGGNQTITSSVFSTLP